MNVQVGHDVSLHHGRGSRSQRKRGPRLYEVDLTANAQKGRTEVVTPLRQTVRLVNTHQRDGEAITVSVGAMAAAVAESTYELTK